MKKQTYWDCSTTGDDVAKKTYVKDGRQRIKVTRTITRDCATGIADIQQEELVITLELIRSLIREELRRRNLCPKAPKTALPSQVPV
jgi:hypothetical protein